MNLDDLVPGTYGGILTRYIQIQVQLTETMKSTKDQSLANNQTLMYPELYGFKSALKL